MWSPGPSAEAPASAAAATAAAGKAAEGSMPAQKENLNPQASPAQSAGMFPGRSTIPWAGNVCIGDAGHAGPHPSGAQCAPNASARTACRSTNQTTCRPATGRSHGQRHLCGGAAAGAGARRRRCAGRHGRLRVRRPAPRQSRLGDIPHVCRVRQQQVPRVSRRLLLYSQIQSGF
jgi:hypothetical protein